MSPHPLAPFRLERWFVEFEFVPGMRSLTASSPYSATTQELLALEDEGTTERYLFPVYNAKSRGYPDHIWCQRSTLSPGLDGDGTWRKYCH